MKDEIEKILARITAPSKTGTEYGADIARMIWIAREYSKADLVTDLRRALNGSKGNTEEAD
jgi:hypothetical protein